MFQGENMARRVKKKSRHSLGNRYRGRGNVKRGRGKGSKGGKGRGGMHKHRWSLAINEKSGPGSFGFVCQNTKAKGEVINLWQINQMVLSGKIEKAASGYPFEFKGKVLGSGEVDFPLQIKAESCSPKAKEKVEKAGGRLETSGS